MTGRFRPLKSNRYGGLLAAAASSTSDAWVVGRRGYIPGLSVGFAVMQHWDGSAWSTTDPMPVGFHVIEGIDTVSPSDAWAVGYLHHSDHNLAALIGHWDGVSWSRAPSPGSLGFSGLTAVDALARDDAWAVGHSRGRTLTEHWDGSGWSVVPSPNVGAVGSALTAVSAYNADDVWALGSWTLPQDVDRPLMLHWDGTAWTRVRLPLALGRLVDVTAVAEDDVWAAGQVGNKTIAIHWDGTAWSIVPTPNFGWWNRLSSVAALGPDDVWAVGEYVAAGAFGRYHPIIINWDGIEWKQVPRPHPAKPSSSGLVSVAAVPGFMVAAGFKSGYSHPLALVRCPSRRALPGYSA